MPPAVDFSVTLTLSKTGDAQANVTNVSLSGTAVQLHAADALPIIAIAPTSSRHLDRLQPRLASPQTLSLGGYGDLGGRRTSPRTPVTTGPVTGTIIDQ